MMLVKFRSTDSKMSIVWNALVDSCNGQNNCSFQNSGSMVYKCGNVSDEYMQVFYHCSPINLKDPVGFTAWRRPHSEARRGRKEYQRSPRAHWQRQESVRALYCRNGPCPSYSMRLPLHVSRVRSGWCDPVREVVPQSRSAKQERFAKRNEGMEKQYRSFFYGEITRS